MIRRLSVLILIVAIALPLFSARPAFAGTATVSGIIDSSDPSMLVVIIVPPNCAGYGVASVHYNAIPFTVDTSGAYTLGLSSTGDFASLYLYAGSFDPGNGIANCVAADNVGPIQVDYSLTAGATYIAVVFDDQYAQAGGSYSLTISGPGEIHFVGGCDAYLNLSGAVVGAFVSDALIYSEPGVLVEPAITIEAGKTYYVLGQDASSQYYKIYLQCQPVWVLKNTVGPNYDAVWNGTPLPTGVVE